MKAEAHTLDEMDAMAESAEAASSLLKALANENRLLILCLLTQGERSVTELEEMLELRQPTVSQQLARLRADDLVHCRRDGKTIYYSIASDEAQQVIDLLYEMFCAPKNDKSARKAAAE